MALNNIMHVRTCFRVSRKYFNMIEVTLAIGIVSLGLVGILSLFPVGFQSIRDAVGDNYVNDASQLFLSYIKLSAKKDISIPPAIQTQTDIDTQWNSTMAAVPTSKPDPDGSFEAVDPSLSGYTLAVSGIYLNNTESGLYRIYQGSSGLNDFKAAVRIWRTVDASPIYDRTTSKWTEYYFDFSKSCALNIEFSWPVEKPYAMRTKRFFYFELFKPQLQ